MQEAVNLRERADLLEALAHLRVRGRELRDLGLEIRQLRVEQLPLDGRAECVAVLVARSHHDCGEAQLGPGMVSKKMTTHTVLDY